MATTPTEVLNDDIKELKLDIRENRTKIDLVKEEVQRLSVAQGVMKVELLEEIHKIALSQSEMKGEFRLVKLFLTFVLAGIVGSLWQFFDLNAKVNGVETRLDRMDSRFDRIEASLDRSDARLERLETSISKILEQIKPASTAQGR